jgi:hypothetical protein
MAYIKKPVLRAHARIVDRREGAVTEDGDPIKLTVAFVVRAHENGRSSLFETRGWGFGRHDGFVSFDTGDGRYAHRVGVKFTGDDEQIELDFVPAGANAVIDGCDEIRF